MANQATAEAETAPQVARRVALRLLVDRAPDWAVIDRENRDKVFLTAAAVHASGAIGREYSLILSTDSAGSVEVRESSGRDGLLPSFCPERHINEDGSFCLGYEAGREILEIGQADAWWNKLRVFLLCQDTAARMRCWPDYAALSHGHAARFQMVAETIADTLGMRDDLTLAMQDGGRIAKNLWQLTNDGKRLINGRLPCVCGRIGKRGRTKLRKECYRDGDLCLVILEAQRRDAERDFWNEKRGRPCCGTMMSCPLDSNYNAKPDRRVHRRATLPNRKRRGI